MKKQVSLVLALALFGALSLGLAPKAVAAGASYTIRYQTDWATVAPGGSITLADGDTLTIAWGAGSPSVATTIAIAANANVTINGGGTMRTGVCVTESSNDTAPHIVTIQDLRFTGSASCGGDHAAYTQYTGTINLAGTNAFVAAYDSYGLFASPFVTNDAARITSAADGTLTVSSDASSRALIWARTLDVQGTAHVTATSNWASGPHAGSTINIDSGASLTLAATSQYTGATWASDVTNNGTFTVSSSSPDYQAIERYAGTLTIRMGAGAVTSITSGVTETDAYAMIPATGSHWQVSGGASLEAPGTVFSSSASVTVLGGTTGVVTLAPDAGATSIGSLPYYGAPRVGGTIAVTPAGVTPYNATLSFQWNLDGVPISGATGVAYVPQVADLGKQLSVTVTANYSDASGVWTPSTATSSAVEVQPGMLTIPKPVIHGTAQVGIPLTASPGGLISSDTVLTYHWFANDVEVGSNSSTYTPTASDVGKTIVVVVDWSQTGYASASQISDPTLPVERARMLRFTESPDMAGDGRGEVLAVDASGILWRYPGTTSGQLGAPVRLASSFQDLLVFGPGDIDGDGKADVLAINLAGDLLLYPGQGAGALGAPRQVGNGWTGWRLIPSGDLTGDGKPDLLGIDSLGDLYMYAGKGNGLFAMKVKVGNGWNGWQLFAAGDLNGDGKTDILGIDGAGNLFQYAGKGTGMFAAKVQAGNGWNGFTLAAGGDLNGDGLADIIGRNDDTGVLYFYRGMGNARFAMKLQIETGW